jgi:hypothetical protein
MSSSEILRRVALVRIDILEELTASIIKTLDLTSKDQPFLPV